MQNGMSASPPKADMCAALGDVRFVPIADILALFDHLVGARQYRRRHRKAKRFRSLEIDDQLILRGQLHWQVAWFLALENAIDI